MKYAAVYTLACLVLGCATRNEPEPEPSAASAGTASDTTTPRERPLSESEARGRAIYRRGEGADAVTAEAIGGVEVPGGALPCASCHGRDGRGRPEGGVRPPDIRWSRLSRSADDGGGGYDRRAVITAVTTGVAPGGRRLDPMMPRYGMAHADAAALADYLVRVGDEPEPGVTSDQVVVVTILPTTGPSADIGAAIRDVLRAYFDEVSDAGGIYGRRIRLVAGSAPDDRGTRRAALLELARRENAFAAVAPLLTGSDPVPAAELTREGLPIVGPFVDTLSAADRRDPTSFYLLGGTLEQAVVLMQHLATTQASGQRVLIVSEPDRGAIAEVALSASRSWSEAPRVADIPADPADADAWRRACSREKRAGITHVLATLDTPRLVALLEAARLEDWTPEVRIPSDIHLELPLAALQSYPGRVLVARSYHPRDIAPEAARTWGLLAEGRGLNTQHAELQFRALAAARVFIEGLRGAGRELDRPGFIAALEDIQLLETGFTPPLGFGVDRHVGANGAWLLEVVDGEEPLRVLGDWIPAR